MKYIFLFSFSCDNKGFIKKNQKILFLLWWAQWIYRIFQNGKMNNIFQFVFSTFVRWNWIIYFSRFNVVSLRSFGVDFHDWLLRKCPAGRILGRFAKNRCFSELWWTVPVSLSESMVRYKDVQENSAIKNIFGYCPLKDTIFNGKFLFWRFEDYNKAVFLFCFGVWKLFFFAFWIVNGFSKFPSFAKNHFYIIYETDYGYMNFFHIPIKCQYL